MAFRMDDNILDQNEDPCVANPSPMDTDNQLFTTDPPTADTEVSQNDATVQEDGQLSLINIDTEEEKVNSDNTDIKMELISVDTDVRFTKLIYL